MPEHMPPPANPAIGLALALIDSSRAPVLLLDAEATILGVSQSFCIDFEFEGSDLTGSSRASR